MVVPFSPVLLVDGDVCTAGVVLDGLGDVPDCLGVVPDCFGVLSDGSGDVPDGSGDVSNGSGIVPDGSGIVSDGSGDVPNDSGASVVMDDLSGSVFGVFLSEQPTTRAMTSTSGIRIVVFFTIFLPSRGTSVPWLNCVLQSLCAEFNRFGFNSP